MSAYFSPGQMALTEQRWKKALVAKTAFAARLERLEPCGPAEEVPRASGKAVCAACGLTYYDHPDLNNFATYTVLCSGEVVKT